MSDDKGLKYTDWSAGFKTFSAGKFAPKLVFQQQMAIYTLNHKLGISINVLADAYGVAPRTVSVLCNNRAKEYRRVKQEIRRLGSLSECYDKYVLEEDIARVQRTVHGRTPLDKKPNQIWLGGQMFTITNDESIDKWVAFSHDIEMELGRFDTWEAARDECLKYAKLSIGQT
jgi:hypothetical protein